MNIARASLKIDIDVRHYHFFCSSLDSEGEGAKTGTESDQSETVQHTSEEAQQASKQAGISRSITVVLANAGCTLEGAEAERVLNPLRFAFETKNLKILEPALDCLHVCNLICHYALLDVFFLKWDLYAVKGSQTL